MRVSQHGKGLFILAMILGCFGATAATDGVIDSVYSASEESSLSADPRSSFWRHVPPSVAENDAMGQPAPGHRTEIRSRWTEKNLYFLFVSNYEQLNLKPNPVTASETNQLWNWDVAEVFIGSDFDHIKRYKEFEVSPQGEWVDLDIDRDRPRPEDGWLWNSGFHSKARIDAKRKMWFAEMQIPIQAVDNRPVQPGREFRINFYRAQGTEPGRRYIAWRPTHSETFHVPEAFGKMQLVRP